MSDGTKLDERRLILRSRDVIKDEWDGNFWVKLDDGVSIRDV